MHTSQVSQPSASKSRGVISTALSTAVRLWLRSQLDQVEDLQVKIETSSRLLVAGTIPKISVSAREAIYQGLYLRQVSLVAKDIQVNLSQILKGKPLRLNQPIPVTGELLLQEADLNNSLTSPLLANGLTEVLTILANKADKLGHETINLKEQQISWQQINLDDAQIAINGICLDSSGEQTPVSLRTNITIENGHKLQLNSIQMQLRSLPKIELDSFELDLGSEVDIEELTLNPGQLICRGSALVIP